MSIGTPAGYGNSPGTSLSGPATATLPTITSDGLAVMLIAMNAASTATIATPTGWTAETTTHDTTNVAYCALFTKPVTSADSGASISSALSASARWAVVGVVLPGASGLDQLQSFTEGTNSAASTWPAVTPGSDDETLLALGYCLYAAPGPTGQTPPGGWTEAVDVGSTNPSGNMFGGWIGYQQLSGGSGASQSGPVTTHTAGRNTGWTISVTPATVTPAGPVWMIATDDGWVAAEAVLL